MSGSQNDLCQALERGKSFIQSDIPIEEVKTLYFDEKHIVPAEQNIYRLDYEGQRFYVEVNQKKEGDKIENEIALFPSVTKIISKTLPMDWFLFKWWLDNGYEKAKKILDISASYGTLLHIFFGEILLQKTIDTRDESLFPLIENHIAVEEKFSTNDIDMLDWVKKIRQDLIGFVQWVRDYNVTPICIEAIFTSHEGIYGTAIDLVAYITPPKEEEIIAIIDFKTGRNSFYDDNPVQLQAHKDIWNEYYPENKVERIFNYGCKDYRIPIGKTVIPYRFQEQTNDIGCKKWEHCLKLFHLDAENMTVKKKTQLRGQPINLSLDFNELYEIIDPMEKFSSSEVF